MLNSKRNLFSSLSEITLGVTFLFNQQLCVADSSEITLEELKVVSPKYNDTKPVKGYNAKQSTTATRTDTDLINVPQAVTVITKDLMADQSMQSIADAVRYVPGVQAAQGEGNRDQLVLRGNNTTSDLFVDGLRDDIQTYRDLYNTDRIEVLKGPNGMIFGRGGAGGVVNRVSKKAGWSPVKEVTLSAGSFDHKRISADYGQGLSDTVAFRLNAVYEDSGSYRDGVNLKRYGLAPSLTVRPSDNTKIELGAEYFKDDRIADRGVPALAGAGNSQLNIRPYNIGNRDQFFGNAQLSPSVAETGAFNAIITHAFDNGVQIKNSTRLANYDKFYQNVFANGAVTNAGQVQLAAYNDKTQRDNFINQTDVTYTAKLAGLEHKILVGAEFNFQDTINQRFTPTGSTTDNGNFAVVSATNPFAVPVNFNQLRRDQKSDVTLVGVYLQDQIILNEHWQAVVGVRHDKVDTDYTNLLPASFAKISVSDSFVSPRAGLIYKPTENSSIYANYSTSYVPRAGDQLVSLTVVNASFAPEKFINKEIGVKWDILPNLALTTALFKLERENIQATDPNNNAQQILLDGQETTGLELALNGKLTEKLQTMASYTLQDGEITKQQGSGNSAILKGSDLALTPSQSFALWNKYQINDRWAVALGVVGRSEMYALLPTASASTILPGYTRFDAAVFAKITPEWHAQINIENLTNKEYALTAQNNNNITPGAPLNLRATLNYQF